MTRSWIVLMLGALLAACAPTPTAPADLPTEATTATLAPATATAPPAAHALWIAPGVPDPLRAAAETWGIPLTANAGQASDILDVRPGTATGGSQWVYALAAPFPTVRDGITTEQLQAVWKGSSREEFGKWPLLMNAATLAAFSEAWGTPGIQVQVLEDDKLVDAAWQQFPSWAILPFEALGPRWKVLTVNGQSPLRKDFDASQYPLLLHFGLEPGNEDATADKMPASNRDPQKLATVIMTGTSALVREIAYQMEVKGLDYPAQDMGDVLRQADVLHVSNEVAFDPNCPPPNPDKNRFYCSDPRYIELFDKLGVDIVEQTGNHILDNGARAMLYSLDLYTQHHMSYFGGGANLADARKVLAIEYHGNKLAFLGCFAGEPPAPTATGTSPGANPCDYPLITSQIRQLRLQGFLPIVTMQYKEGYSPKVMPWQELDFRKMAAAGAVVVSGSQSHVPMEMEFYNDSFIHFGLGNFLFGQMGNQPPGPGLPLQPSERYEFLDRHVFYDGRYIGTELLTAMLEDYARPRPMTPDERAFFLKTYFGYSDWLPLIPTPAPAVTPTRYPLLQFSPLPTHTPLPAGTPTP